MKLLCHVLPGRTVDIHPASARRDWMDATPNQHAYRCLPLSHANQHGWEIRCSQTVIVRWSGAPEQSALQITTFGRHSGGPDVVSAFGSGIVTFNIPCIFKTPPGVNLWAMGPPNHIKDGAQALSGIVETDWLEEHSFTMNWKLTRPGVEVVFQKGEPFCFITPTPRGFVESFEPHRLPINSAPKVAAAHQQGTRRRQAFQARLDIRQDGAVMQPGDNQGSAWQRRYYRGINASGGTVSDHQTRLHVQPFTDSMEE